MQCDTTIDIGQGRPVCQPVVESIREEHGHAWLVPGRLVRPACWLLVAGLTQRLPPDPTLLASSNSQSQSFPSLPSSAAASSGFPAADGWRDRLTVGSPAHGCLACQSCSCNTCDDSDLRTDQGTIGRPLSSLSSLEASKQAGLLAAGRCLFVLLWCADGRVSEDKLARIRFSICQTQPKLLQILRRQCCLSQQWGKIFKQHGVSLTLLHVLKTGW